MLRNNLYRQKMTRHSLKSLEMRRGRAREERGELGFFFYHTEIFLLILVIKKPPFILLGSSGNQDYITNFPTF